ncbi:MAG: S-DNA-T family DNA segregation ATPase FtsK/SpoIIIE [Paracoccaceae bacterium]|jgi:S-DNA-T family DNA segregation ATPase FtsK/SpoIIIE
MAFQTRKPQPIMDNHVKVIIDRKSRELLGLCLLAVGGIFLLILFSYSPKDPGWLSATGASPTNIMGQFGASVSSSLFMIIGFSSWSIPLIFISWGVRFLAHKGSTRAIGRLIFAPIAIASISIYASTYIPNPEWSNPFGIGGLFGDMVLGSIITIISATEAIHLTALSGTLLLISGGLLLFILGFEKSELKAFFNFLIRTMLLIYFNITKALARLVYLLVVWTIKINRIMFVKEESFSDSAEDTVNQWELQQGKDFQDGSNNNLGSKFYSVLKKVFFNTDDFKKNLNFEPALSHKNVLDAEDRISSKISSIIQSRRENSGNIDNNQFDVDLKDLAFSPDDNEDDWTEGFERADSSEGSDNIYGSPRIRNSNNSDGKPMIEYPIKKNTTPSRKAQTDAQPNLKFEDVGSKYELPPLSLLKNISIIERQQVSEEALEENARMLEAVLDDYGVKGDIVSVRPGPVVTMYELEPAPGLKASRVIGLADDIARSMSALSARVSTVPGRSVIGIELPNINREMVGFREILSSREFGDGKQKLGLALGKDIGGVPAVADLAKMPHLLIAGTTGSGKSVAINTMILSLLYKLTPEECRMIMIDPKMLELSVYDGIPHLLSPVVTDPKKAVVALKWAVGEMEDRYRKMSKMGVRNIDGFNGRVKDALSKGEMFSRTVQTGFDQESGDPVFETDQFKPEAMPYIVVVVDEMADLMMVAGKEIEACIQRLAQMARASGIHLIMATQRPSVDVITGTIKANFPTRISFQVTSKIDSRTILGEMGAEQLLGMGDMLYMAGGSKITRVHGPFVSDEEVEEVVNHLKGFGPPEYMSSVLEGNDEEKESEIDLVLGLGSENDNQLYDFAVKIVLNDRKCSTSYIQRKLSIGYNKAAKIVEEMEAAGLVSAANHVGKREILVPER